MTALPAPSPEALAHSQRLVAHIQAEIAAAGGWIDFARYMELALYAPGLGYYAAGARKFGAAGDFVTAPELTPLFGQALARQAAEVLAQTGGGIVELGAGSGRLAVDLIQALEAMDQAPAYYAILEPSPDLRQRQRDRLIEALPHWRERVRWLDRLPERHVGLVLGNEVLDALPVHLLHWTDGGCQERGVVTTAAGFDWADRPLTAPHLAEWAAALPVSGGDYLSEVCPAAAGLVGSLAECLEQGMLLFLDYGFPRAEYYHPQRATGTLMCHYRHHALDAPFFLPGLTDLTAHVDFTAIADAALEAGLEVLGYASQAHFLLNCGLLDRLATLEPGSSAYVRATTAVNKLITPSEMGELFKVMALGKELDLSPLGFFRGDRRHAL